MKNKTILWISIAVLLSLCIILIIPGRIRTYQYESKISQLPISEEIESGDAKNIEFVAQMGGGIYNEAEQPLAIQGAYAYLGLGPRLVVLDISNPLNIEYVGKSELLPNPIISVVLEDYLAYVYVWKEMITIDISNPTMPVIVQHQKGWPEDFEQFENIFSLDPKEDILTPKGEGEILLMDGDHAYVEMNGNLSIYDLQDDGNPILLDEYVVWRGDEITLEGTIAVVGGYLNTDILVLDLTNPRDPVVVFTIENVSSAREMVIREKWLYVAAENFLIYNLTELPQVQVVEMDAPVVSIEIAGDFAYLLDVNKNISVVNVSDPASVYMVASYSSLEGVEEATDIKIKDDYLYIAGEELAIFDVSDPESIINMDVIDFEPGTYSWYSLWGKMILQGNTLFHPEEIFLDHGDIRQYQMRLIDTADMADINSFYMYWLPRLPQVASCSQCFSFSKEGDFYIFIYNDHLHLLDFSDPLAPVELGYYGLPGYYFIMEAVMDDDGYIYVIDYTGGLYVLRYTP